MWGCSPTMQVSSKVVLRYVEQGSRSTPGASERSRLQAGCRKARGGSERGLFEMKKLAC